MISVEYKKLVRITALASVLIINAVTIANGHIALARHDSTKVFENSHINLQTDTGQSQNCDTAGSTSPISDSCAASSTNTISQGTPSAPSSPCTATSHPTVLTLSLEFTSVAPGQAEAIIGTLTDTCTGSRIPSETITFTFTDTPNLAPFPTVTDAAGVYAETFGVPVAPGTYTVQAHFAGQGIFGPSNSATQTYTVT
jgi:hypothetical protein